MISLLYISGCFVGGLYFMFLYKCYKTNNFVKYHNYTYLITNDITNYNYYIIQKIKFKISKYFPELSREEKNNMLIALSTINN